MTPLLDTIRGPADLRQLSAGDLEDLCAEIRSVLLSSVAASGGHLGSNLGVVELTIALHRVFESPRDAIVWDTGHQAYVHKLLTGRRHRFDRLRRADGLSGYPSRAESPHDWVENSHASTALSWCHGLAAAASLGCGPGGRRVIAVVGDGALTGGMAYEALNNLGHHRVPVVVVLNDNGRSYAPTVSSLSQHLSRTRLNPRWDPSREDPPSFFDALGLEYRGPVDGHDLDALAAALEDAAAVDGPVVVHVLTRKGRGYPPAEEDDEKCLHDVSAFDPAVGPLRRRGEKYTDVFSRALLDAAEQDHRVVAITAGMPGSTGLLPFQHRFPDRFVDVGIAEQHAVTMAAGMAMAGLRPVVAVYSTFLTRALDQVNLDVGLHRVPVVFCVDRAGITGPDGPSHHGLLDLALLTKVPGMTVFAPSSAEDLEVMLAEALAIDSGPCAIRWPSATARHVPPTELGTGLRARRSVAGDGTACLIAVGRMVPAAEEAAQALAAAGLRPTVWDVRVARPLDPAMLSDAAAHDLVVVVEDGIRDGGVGASVMQAIGASTRVLPLGVPKAHVPHGAADALLSCFGLDGAGIAGAVAAAVVDDAGGGQGAQTARTIASARN